MSRYKDAEKKLKTRTNKIKKDHFPNLANVEIKVLLDTKKKMSGGKIRMAEIKPTDEMIRFLTKEQTKNLNGYDYIMIVDEKLFANFEKQDTKRVLFHELKHCFIDDKGKCKTIPHDFEGFYDEIEYNKDDPEWKNRMTEVLIELHREEE